MTAQVFAEHELAGEIERIRRAEAAGQMDWLQAAELIEQAHDQADALAGEEPLSVFQLARLRRVDLWARWLELPATASMTFAAQVVFLKTASREELVGAILAAQ
jgi:hypothetical protein